MPQRSLLLVLLGLSIAPLAASLAAPRPSDAAPAATPTLERLAQQPPLPIQATINVEGEPVAIDLEPYRPDGVPLEMAVPVGRFTPSVETGDRESRVRLTASYQGEITNEDAYLEIFWPEPAIGLEEGLGRVAGTGGWADREGIEPIDGTVTSVMPGSTFYPWEVVRWNFQTETDSGIPVFGQVILGDIDGQTFWVVSQLPGEFAEGYGPRVDVIAETLRGR